MSSYAFARRPKWIASHVLVVLLVALMIAAMFWQISRLHEKQARNRTIVARTDEPVAPVADLTEPGAHDAAKALDFRPVTATGTYLADQEVLVRGRSNNGAPGSWVLTPLDLGGGVAVVVNRGWIENNGRYESVPDAVRAPKGKITVRGYARRSERRGSFGARDPEDGTLTNLARADVERLDQQVPEELLPVYIQLESQQPPVTSTDPTPVPLPELSEGPHLSYAVQWAIFSIIAVVGYVLILRRRARQA